MDYNYEIEANGWSIFFIGGLSFYGAQSLIVDVLRIIKMYMLT